MRKGRWREQRTPKCDWKDAGWKAEEDVWMWEECA